MMYSYERSFELSSARWSPDPYWKKPSKPNSVRESMDYIFLLQKIWLQSKTSYNFSRFLYIVPYVLIFSKSLSWYFFVSRFAMDKNTHFLRTSDCCDIWRIYVFFCEKYMRTASVRDGSRRNKRYCLWCHRSHRASRTRQWAKTPIWTAGKSTRYLLQSRWHRGNLTSPRCSR